jgi:hypothetical protein
VGSQNKSQEVILQAIRDTSVWIVLLLSDHIDSELDSMCLNLGFRYWGHDILCIKNRLKWGRDGFEMGSALCGY